MTLEATTRRSLTVKQKAMLAAPPVLVVAMYIAFQQLTAHLGFPLGYLVAFSLYWVVWCLALPIVVLGPRRVVALFQPGDSRFAQLGIRIQSILWWPIVFPLSFAFLPRIAAASISVVLASVAVGVIIGVTEKLLWRGVYVTLFADNIWLNTIYPSVAFGLWHLARCRLYQAGTPVALCRSPRTRSRSDCPMRTMPGGLAPSCGAPCPTASMTHWDSEDSRTSIG